MDTRSKIVDLDCARASGAAFVAGYFDPLTPPLVRRLEELRTRCARLAVLVCEPERPVLEVSARAQLLAALACVDFVIVAPRLDWPPLLADERDFHARAFADLVEHVHQRNGTR